MEVGPVSPNGQWIKRFYTESIPVIECDTIGQSVTLSACAHGQLNIDDVSHILQPSYGFQNKPKMWIIFMHEGHSLCMT
jgi:hypothetical protein